MDPVVDSSVRARHLAQGHLDTRTLGVTGDCTSNLPGARLLLLRINRLKQIAEQLIIHTCRISNKLN